MNRQLSQQISERFHKHKPLIALALIGLIDAISFLVVGPSLIFYVQECGGSKEQYGLILSIFSLASFLTKPILGHWSDVGGNIFRLPYLTSILIAALGGLLYFCASLVKPDGYISIGFVLVGRVLGGVGAANAALGFAYVATIVPADEQTKINSLLSMTRIVGMTVGPFFNVLLKDIDTVITFNSTTKIQLDPLNSVGLFLLGTNLLGFVVLYILLEDPPPREKLSSQILSNTSANTSTRNNRNCSLLSQIICKLDISLPIFTIFMFNANFQV